MVNSIRYVRFTCVVLVTAIRLTQRSVLLLIIRHIDVASKLAGQAYDVLHDWSLVPGADEQDIINPVALEDWVKLARKLLAAAGRGEIGDSKIGEILSAAKREPDQIWPPEPVREIIERFVARLLSRASRSVCTIVAASLFACLMMAVNLYERLPPVSALTRKP